ncbi:Uncharacterized protein ALO70_04850, partial [Pseudomonas amygdali pv. eriobotryae]
KTVVLSYRPGGMRVYGQAQALTDFPVPLIPGPQISASVRRSGARAKGRIASVNNALTAKNHGPVQLNRDNDYIRMD